MRQPFFALLLLLLCNKIIAQQTTVSKDHPVTFKLKITEFAKPDTISIVWFMLPYKQGSEQVSLFSNSLNAEGLYQQTMYFNDSLVGKTVGYLYATNHDEYDIMRTFIVQKNQTPDRIESWGYVDGLLGKVKATKMLFTEPDSPDEKMEFTKPFVGITTNGTAIENLFPIKKTGSSTLPIKNAVAAFLETLSKEEKENSFFLLNQTNGAGGIILSDGKELEYV